MSSGVPLTPPWELRWSKTKSRFYYFNLETKLSQWKRPRSLTTHQQQQPPVVKGSNIKKCMVENKLIVKMSGKNSSKVTQDGAKVPVNFRLPQRNVPSSSVPSATSAPSKPSKPAKPTSANDHNFNRNNPVTKTEAAGGAVTSVPKTGTSNKRGTPQKRNQPVSSAPPAAPPTAPPAALPAALPAASIYAGPLSSPTSTEFLSTLAQRVPPWYDMSVRVTAEMEEDMEVECSEEVQLIFEEIQGVRNEMQESEIEEFAGEVQMIVDSMISISALIMPSTLNQKMWIVLDTNLFLEDAGSYLLQLKDWMTQNSQDFIFVIPYIVIQELDRIKDNKRKNRNLQRFNDLGKWEKIQFWARKAIDKIHDWLSVRDPLIMCQTSSETIRKLKNEIPIENNDDRILHCCLQYQEKYSAYQVALFTLDKNLRNKAMIAGVHAFSRESLNKWLLEVFPNYKWFQLDYNGRRNSSRSRVHCSQRPNSVQPIPSVPPISSVQPQSCEDEAARNKELIYHMKAFTSSMHSQSESPMEADSRKTSPTKPNDASRTLENTMLNGLSIVIELSMKDIYKEFWERTLKMEKPWSLRSVAAAIEKLWTSVFKSFWYRSDLDLLKDLAISIEQCSASSSNLLDLIEKCKRFWTAFCSPKWCHETKLAAKFIDVRSEMLTKLQSLENSLTLVPDNNATDGNADMSVPSVNLTTLTSCTYQSESPNAAFANRSSPSAMLTSTDSEDELQNVVMCFNNVLRQIISMRDLLKMQLPWPLDREDRQCVVSTYMSLCQYTGILYEQYQKSMLTDAKSDDSESYGDLAATLVSFSPQSSLPMPPFSVQAMKSFFCDKTRTDMVQIGLSQIQSLVVSLLEGCQHFSSSEVSPEVRRMMS